MTEEVVIAPVKPSKKTTYEFVLAACKSWKGATVQMLNKTVFIVEFLSHRIKVDLGQKHAFSKHTAPVSFNSRHDLERAIARIISESTTRRSLQKVASFDEAQESKDSDQGDIQPLQDNVDLIAQLSAKGVIKPTLLDMAPVSGATSGDASAKGS